MKPLYLLPLLLAVSALAQTPKKDHAPKLVLPQCDTINNIGTPAAGIPCDFNHVVVLPNHKTCDLSRLGGYPEGTELRCDENSVIQGINHIPAPKPPKGWKFHCAAFYGAMCHDPDKPPFPSLELDAHELWLECHQGSPQCWDIPDQIPFGDIDCLKVKCHPMNLIDANDAYLAAPGYGMEMLSDEGPELPWYTASGSVGQLHTCGEGMCGIETGEAAKPEVAHFNFYSCDPPSGEHPCWLTPPIVATMNVDGSVVTVYGSNNSRISTLTQVEQEELDAATEAVETAKKKIATAHGVYVKPPSKCDIDGIAGDFIGMCISTGQHVTPSDTYSIHDGYIFINVAP